MSKDWRCILQNYYGDYEADSLNSEWDSLRTKYSKGDHIDGIVIARSQFGLWIDIGEKFPALIETIHIVGMNADVYKDDDYFPVGSTIQTMFRGFYDVGHQIRLEQANLEL